MWKPSLLEEARGKPHVLPEPAFRTKAYLAITVFVFVVIMGLFVGIYYVYIRLTILEKQVNECSNLHNFSEHSGYNPDVHPNVHYFEDKASNRTRNKRGVQSEQVSGPISNNTKPPRAGRKSKERGRRGGKAGVMHLHYAHSPQEQKNTLQVQDASKELGPWTIVPKVSSNYNTFAQLEASVRIRIRQSGMYWVYSQFTYFDRTGRWAHGIEIDGEIFIKCVSGESGIDTDEKTGLYFNTIHHCYSAAPAYIKKNAVVSIRSLYPDRSLTLETRMTFWGIARIA